MDPLQDVRSLIEKKLASGALPNATPVLTSEGMGIGRPCAACGINIRPTDVECLADVPFHPLLRFHFGCFTEWRRQQQGS
jgi:hypothetical protein